MADIPREWLASPKQVLGLRTQENQNTITTESNTPARKLDIDIKAKEEVGPKQPVDCRIEGTNYMYREAKAAIDLEFEDKLKAVRDRQKWSNTSRRLYGSQFGDERKLYKQHREKCRALEIEHGWRERKNNGEKEKNKNVLSLSNLPGSI